MMARRVCVEGNCRVHDIEMVQSILQTDESRPRRSLADYQMRDHSVHLHTIREERASKYRAMSHFTSKWTPQFIDVDDVKMLFQCGISPRRFADQFTEEEKIVAPDVVERFNPSRYNAQALLSE